jgi:hypothetical protein
VKNFRPFEAARLKSLPLTKRPVKLKGIRYTVLALDRDHVG